MSTRREARERALSLCYELDVRPRPVDDLLGELPVPPDPYTEAVVRGVAEERDELDDRISGRAEHWRPERMAVIDRALLRIGLWELLRSPEVPTGAILNEAVDLATRYSTEESGRFVNGVLSALAREARREEGSGDALAG